MAAHLRIVDAKPYQVMRPFGIGCPHCPRVEEDNREGLAVRKICAHIVHDHPERVRPPRH